MLELVLNVEFPLYVEEASVLAFKTGLGLIEYRLEVNELFAASNSII